MGTGLETAEALIQIEHGSEIDAFEAATLLADATGARLIAELTRILRSGEKRSSREAAAYALTWHNDRKAIEGLLTCASDHGERDSVRAQAVEGLAMHLEFDPARSRWRRRAEDLMIELLQSPFPALRFWACFGLGTLRSRRAVPRLRKLERTDRSVCPGWWYVREEAEDAIWRIAGRAPQDRLLVPMRRPGNTESDPSPKRRPARQFQTRTRREGGGR